MNLYLLRNERELIVASKKGNIDKIKKLITDPTLALEYYDPSTSRTALMLASQYGHAHLVRLLAEKDTRRHIDLQDRAIGKTALMIACEHGHIHVAKALLDNKARVKLQQKTGCTALILAAKYGHVEIARLLIHKGSEVDTANRNGFTALMLTIIEGSATALKMVELLLHVNANLHLKDTEGRTALVHAIKHDRKDIIQLLMEKGAQLEMNDSSEKKPSKRLLQCAYRISSLIGFRKKKVNQMDVTCRTLGSRRNKDLLKSHSVLGLDERNDKRRFGGDLTNNIVRIEVPFGISIDEVYHGVHDGPILGTGISGTVRLCVHKKTGMKYAVKCLDLDQIESDEGLRQLREEIGIMCQLDHPNIIRLEEVYETYNEIYLVLELCIGGELFDRLDEQPEYHYSETACARMVKQMLDAVAYIHSKGIIHRDLKLENFLFVDRTSDSDIKMIDFGLSKHFRVGDIHHDAVGTPYTVAPEVLKGSYDERCDMWGIGVITFLLLSGESPFGGFSGPDPLIHLRQNILEGFYSFQPRQIWEGISNEAKTFIRGLLVVDPKKRCTAEKCLKSFWMQNWIQRQAPQDNSLSPRVLQALVAFRDYSLLMKWFCAVLSFALFPDQTNFLRNEFQKLDNEGKGEISLSAFTKAVNIPEKGSIDIEYLFNTIQIRSVGSHRMRWHDFLAAGIGLCDIDDRNIKLAFDRMDSEHKGFISFDNMMELMGRDGFGMEDELRLMWDEMIYECRRDKEDVLTLDDFMSIMKTNLLTPSAVLRKSLSLVPADILSMSHQSEIYKQSKSDSTSTAETAVIF